MNINPTWTDARIERLTELWRDGMSAGQIAKILGGVSRNAVIGKVHRLNLHHDVGHEIASKIKQRADDKKRAAKRDQIERDRAMREERRKAAALMRAKKLAEIEARAIPPSPVVASIARPDPLNFSLIDLGANDCRFPVSGEKAGTLFCGHNVDQGGTYCTYHARVAYIPREVRLSKKRAA